MVANYVGAYLLLGLVAAGILWMVGAKRFAAKMIGLLLLAGAVANMVPPFLRWLTQVLLPVVRIALWLGAGAVVVAAGVATWRYWHHRHELRTWKPRPALSPKRRVERE